MMNYIHVNSKADVNLSAINGPYNAGTWIRFLAMSWSVCLSVL